MKEQENRKEEARDNLLSVLAVATVIVAILIYALAERDNTKKAEELIEAGEYVEAFEFYHKTQGYAFGGHRWAAVDFDKDKVLLVLASEQDLGEAEYRPYDENGRAIWAESSLRNWLNRSFFESFSAEEKSRIVETQNDGIMDRVFLLSAEEARLLPAKKSAACSVIFYWVGDGDNSSIGRHEWWLRTPGTADGCAMFVTKFGEIAEEGHPAGEALICTVRPAMWVRLGN